MSVSQEVTRRSAADPNHGVGDQYPVCRCHAGAAGYFYGDGTAALAGVQVDLPKAQTSVITETDEPLQDHRLRRRLFAGHENPVKQIISWLIAVTGANPDIRIFVRGDKTIDYGRVMQVMGTINAGFRKVALITELP